MTTLSVCAIAIIVSTTCYQLAVADPVAFYALKRTAENVTGTIKFEDESMHYGGSFGDVYDPATGQFTAPVSGMYVLSWTIVTMERHAVGTELIVESVPRGKNGRYSTLSSGGADEAVIKGRNFADARDSTGEMDDSGTMTVVLHMNSGDRASIRVMKEWDNYVDGNGWSSFSGHRLVSLADSIPIAFHASKRDAENVTGVVQFKNVSLNYVGSMGNVYNPTTGQFTAPEDGMYLLTWTIVTSAREAVGTELIVESVKGTMLSEGKNFADARDSTSSQDSSTMTAIIRMSRGDKTGVRVMCNWNNYVDGNDLSSFSGYKLY